MGRHRLGKKKAQENDLNETTGWLARVKEEPVIHEAPKIRPEDCIICQTYTERGLLPPRDHVCRPMGLADRPQITVLRGTVTDG